MEMLTNYRDCFHGPRVVEGLENWLQNKDMTTFRSFPFVVVWVI